MSELEKVNKFSNKVSPKGEPKLFITSPFGLLVKAFTEEEVKDYVIVYVRGQYEIPEDELRSLLEDTLQISEAKVVDLKEGDEPHS